MASRSTTRPTTSATAMPPTSTPRTLRVTWVIVRYAPKAPAMKNSGCAMFTTRITLNTREKPRATTAYVLPIMSPLSTCWRKRSMRASAAQVHSLDALARLERARGALAHQTPDLEQIGVVRNLEGLAGVLLHHQDAEAAPVDLLDLLEQPLHDLGGEAEGGLVPQQAPRLRHQRPRDRQHLLLAARERPRHLRPSLPEPGEERADLVEPVGKLRAAAPREGPHLEVLVHGERGEELAALGDPGDAELVDAVRREPVDRPFLELDRARARLHESEDRLDGAALPGAVRAEDGPDLPLRDLEADAGHGGNGTVADLEARYPGEHATSLSETPGLER